MSKRRSRFEIDLPDAVLPDAPVTPVPEAASTRRGPMATAVGETADSLKERRAIEEGIRAENDALAHEFVRLRKLGLVVAEVPVGSVDCTKLVRDRRAGDDADLSELKTSIAEIGLSNPIQVEEAGDGRFELIQGFRRLSAYARLHAEQGDAWATIPAVIVPAGETIEHSYRRMVDENLVRSDISFAEMGELARAYAADPATDCASADDAVAVLFRSAGYQKRTYIRNFARLMDLIGAALSHPETLSRNLGLAVLKRLEAEPKAQAALVAALKGEGDPKAQTAILIRFTEEGARAAPRKAAPKCARVGTTLRLDAGGRKVTCIAGHDRLELSGGLDFSAYERDRLERAVAAFFAALDGN